MSAAEEGAQLADLVRILAKVAAGDLSEKPTIREGDDDLAKFALAVRFMIDDLEHARHEEERRQTELEAANARLRELSDMKTRFINTAAHELNTPLTPIALQLRMLRSGTFGPLAPKQQRSVEILERNFERLTHLVSDVLDAARLQSEHMKLNPAPNSLAALVHEAAEVMGPQAEAAGVTLEAAIEGEVHADVDRHRISQVLVNLASNALKFTPRGGRLRIALTSSSTHARIRVTDTGAGMTREQVERLFQPFSQVHDPTVHLVGGTGLGLFISRGIVEQHGGRIWCESDGPGRGSTFAFEIPLRRPGLHGEVEFGRFGRLEIEPRKATHG